MINRSTLIVISVITLSICGGEVASAQHWYRHEHGMFVSPHLSGPTVCLDLCPLCGCFGCGEVACLQPPAIIVAPIFPNLQPMQRPFPVDFVPAERQAIENFGNDPGNLLAPRGPLDPLQEIRRRASVLKRSTPAGRQRADRSISAGDQAFADQVYARATARYRDAIARAPDYATAHFRLAHAYVATRQYNLALNSALIALELAGTSRRDGFALAEMYRGNKLARELHEERLLDASLRQPQDGGLLFLIGMTLHYGGNPLKAREHFRAAAEIPGVHQTYVRHFLPVVPVQEPDLPVAAAN